MARQPYGLPSNLAVIARTYIKYIICIRLTPVCYIGSAKSYSMISLHYIPKNLQKKLSLNTRSHAGCNICNVEHVLGRMPYEELSALVFELLPKTTVILDFDNASRLLTDQDIRDFLTSTYGLRDVSDILLYSRDRQRDILRSAKEYGASIRQLSRLTGISIGIIRNT